MIKIYQVGVYLPHKTVVFPGGEVHVTLAPSIWHGTSVEITAHIYSSQDLIELLMLTDALKRQDVKEIALNLPYLPYARQDRVSNDGESLSLKVFCDLINAQNYKWVRVWDCHSDVGLALLDRVDHVQQYALLTAVKPTLGTLLVAPDAGALKKIYKASETLGCDFIRADKTRDTVTGKITGTVVHSKDVGFANLLIVDDICDGGRTFIDLAHQLRKITRGEIHLYVTHGIFSQGLAPFEGVIDRIFCPNVWENVPDHPLLKRI